jgi:hypothetical protein
MRPHDSREQRNTLYLVSSNFFIFSMTAAVLQNHWLHSAPEEIGGQFTP